MTSKKILSFVSCSLLFLAVAASAQRTPSPPGAAVYIISPANGETVPSTFTVVFGLKGMGVAPAGIDLPDTGHHHLLINAKALPDLNLSMPMTPELLHFGKGQTEAEITLPKGRHTLQLILGDKLHIPHDPAVISEKIEIIVAD